MSEIQIFTQNIFPQIAQIYAEIKVIDISEYRFSMSEQSKCNNKPDFFPDLV